MSEGKRGIRRAVLFALLAAVAGMAGLISGTAAVAAPGAGVRGGVLDAVACPGANSCWAVGSQRTVGRTRTLIERWNGLRWRVAASPAAASKDTVLSAVSCASTSSCWAVGAVESGTAARRPIAEHWNGRKWSLMVLAEPAGSAALFGVSCAPDGRCWAVGTTNPGMPSGKPLAEHWTGKRWSVVRNAAAHDDVLLAVSCRRNASCWAVGAGNRDAPAEHWNGTTWSLAATPPTLGGLAGVACPGTDCFAVGEDGFPAALAERWNGSRWSVMHTPQPAGSQASGFGGVSCISSKGCFAVGLYFKNFGSDVNSELIEQLRGSTWVIVRSSNPAGAALADLHGVACASARACWAVGEQEKTLVSPSRTLAEHWNGTRWSIVPTP